MAVGIQGQAVVQPLDGGLRVAFHPAGERGGVAHLHNHIGGVVDDAGRRLLFCTDSGAYRGHRDIVEIEKKASKCSDI